MGVEHKPLLCLSIKEISNYWSVEAHLMGRMHPQLMGASGYRVEINICAATLYSNNFKKCNSLFTSFKIHLLRRPVVIICSQWE